MPPPPREQIPDFPPLQLNPAVDIEEEEDRNEDEDEEEDHGQSDEDDSPPITRNGTHPPHVPLPPNSCVKRRKL